MILTEVFQVTCPAPNGNTQWLWHTRQVSRKHFPGCLRTNRDFEDAPRQSFSGRFPVLVGNSLSLLCAAPGHKE